MTPGLGAESAMVNTSGSGMGGDPGTGLEGVMRELCGKRM